MRQKISLFLLLAGLLVGLLTGCSQPKELTKLPEELTTLMADYESAAEIQYGKLKATANISRTEAKALTLSFLEPEGLKGLEAKLTEGNLFLGYQGMEVSLSSLPFQNNFVGTLIESAINHATKADGIQVSLSQGKMIVTGENDQGTYSLQLDEKTGVFLQLDYPSIQFSAKFYEFRFTATER